MNLWAMMVKKWSGINPSTSLRKPLDVPKLVPGMNDLLVSFHTHFKNSVDTDAHVHDLMYPCPRLKDKVIICVTDLTRANIRVIDVIKDLTAGQTINLDLHCNEISTIYRTLPPLSQNRLKIYQSHHIFMYFCFFFSLQSFFFKIGYNVVQIIAPPD